jgi:hypothetical protein
MDSASASTAAIGAMSIFSIGIFCLIGLIFALAIGGTIFWIFMLVDAVKREWPDRQVWIIILAVSFAMGFHIIAALVYYFMVKRANVGVLKP